MREESFSGAFEINQYPFSKDYLSVLENHLAKENWPLVYILSDEKLKQAYIGESTNAFSRLLNHLNNPDRKKLGKLHLITSEKFNKSATLDIESYLIAYMAADGKYVLQNGNAGIVDHNYYQRQNYRKVFKEIWDQLSLEKLTLNDLQTIDNSDLFKYSPYKALTTEQYRAIKSILEAIVVGGRPILIDGSAGTGKTVLAVFLTKLLVADESELEESEDVLDRLEIKNLLISLRRKFEKPKVALLVPMASLRKTIKRVFKNVKGLQAKMVIGPAQLAREKFDILIVDEAHRLKRRKNLVGNKSFDDVNQALGFDKSGNELDWVLKQSEHQVFFYDPRQSVKPSDIPRIRFSQLENRARKITLVSQLRVRGGNDYIDFVGRLLDPQLVYEGLSFENENYDLRFFDSFKSFVSEIREKEKQFGLCRMVAGYAWKWVSRKSKDFDINIEGVKLNWNSVPHDWVNSPKATEEVGCIHTTQGYDLNYAGVIFGNEITYDPYKDEIVIVRDNYHDIKGKGGVDNPETLKNYILNIYQTLMLRGIRGTYVYVCDQNLRDYLRKYIPVAASETPTTPEEKEEKTPLFRILRNEEVRPYENSLPLLNIQAAAGSFSEAQAPEEIDWVEIPEGYTFGKDHFVCQVLGNSMSKVIPDGTYCLFKKDSGGSREGQIVLVEHHSFQESDFGAGYTVKEYSSEKVSNEEAWRHKRITLKPKSFDTAYEEIILEKEALETFRVIGIFVCVLS